MAQIMRKYFGRLYPRLFAETFHLSPDVRPIQRFTVFRSEHRTRPDVLLPAVGLQHAAQLRRQQNNAALSFAVHLRPSGAQRGYGNKL